MSLLIIQQKELKTRYRRPICTPCSLQHYSQWPRHGNKLIIYQKLNGLNNQRHWNKEQTDSNQRGGGREITGKERKRSSRNVCKWSMDKAKGGRNEGGRWAWVGRGKVVAAKWRQLYLNNNFLKRLNKRKKLNGFRCNTHTQDYSAARKKEILLFMTTWMDSEGIMLSEISQTGQDKRCMTSFICRLLRRRKKANS